MLVHSLIVINNSSRRHVEQFILMTIATVYLLSLCPQCDVVCRGLCRVVLSHLVLDRANFLGEMIGVRSKP